MEIVEFNYKKPIKKFYFRKFQEPAKVKVYNIIDDEAFRRLLYQSEVQSGGDDVINAEFEVRR